jgi:hypothetical protein
MKSFQEFLSESITINGDFNGTLNVGGSQPEPATESYVADVVWEGKIYRLEIEGTMPSKNELAEQLQDEYPGAVVHNLYPSTTGSLKIKSSQRYRPERLGWGE